MPKIDEAHPATTSAAQEARPQRAHLELVDLLSDLDTLTSLLEREVMGATSAGGDAELIDAFLLAAGISQVVEDFGVRARSSSAATASVAAFRTDLDQLTCSLAEFIAGANAEPAAQLLERCRATTQRLLADTSRLPSSLRESVLRLPDCFRSFDQQPADLAALAHQFSEGFPDRDVPVTVVGVRTSGSYLCPLLAAYLRKIGYRLVVATTMRPGQPTDTAERGLRLEAAKGGVALLVDDPPVTGGKLAQAAAELEAFGFQKAKIVLLIALFGTAAAVPERLRGYQVVPLPWAEWEVNRRLDALIVRDELNGLLQKRVLQLAADRGSLVASSVASVERIPLDPVQDIVARPLVRSHVRARYRVLLMGETGTMTVEVYVKGTGLGYLGRHSWVLSERLREHVPAAIGWSNGLLYRVASPESSRATNAVPPVQELVSAVVGYTLARSERLSVNKDRSGSLRGRHAAWEMLADILTANHGRLRRLTRPAIERLARSCVSADTPSVVDGSMAFCHWFQDPLDEQHLVKVDYDERAFSVWDAYCYDTVRDLGGAAADARIRAERHNRTLDDDASTFDYWTSVASQLRLEYERRTHSRIADERWTLYQLLTLHTTMWHLLRLERQGPGQLQSDAGIPYDSPRVTVAGFESAVTAEIATVKRAIKGLRAGYVAGARRTARHGDGRALHRPGRDAGLLLLALTAADQKGIARASTCARLLVLDAISAARRLRATPLKR